MPLYEYVCQECTHTFETLVFGSETPTCPACESAHLERQISVPAAPRTESAALPMKRCLSDGPPCGPACSRFPGS